MGGFFAMPTRLLLESTPAATGFKIAFEAIVHGGRNLRVMEIPIAFCDRARGVSKMRLGVALLFGCPLARGHGEDAFPTSGSGGYLVDRAARFSIPNSTASPAKRSKVANNAFP